MAQRVITKRKKTRFVACSTVANLIPIGLPAGLADGPRHDGECDGFFVMGMRCEPGMEKFQLIEQLHTVAFLKNRSDLRQTDRDQGMLRFHPIQQLMVVDVCELSHARPERVVFGRGMVVELLTEALPRPQCVRRKAFPPHAPVQADI